jgi:hypothetical protein
VNKIIDFLGNKVSIYAEKDLLPSKGLVRLAIRDDYGQKSSLSYSEIKHVINNGLKNRLEKIRVSNIDTIVSNLLGEMTEKQSLLMMMGV